MLSLSLLTASSPSFTFIGTSSPSNKYKIMVNYNGQADLFLSLQITPDYYPYQFKQKNLYDYLTKVNKYLVVNEKTSESKKKFGEKLQTRLNELIQKVKTFGPSLWNEDLYEGGLVHRNDQFWTSKEADYLFLEQFIIDDYADPLFLVNKLPKHKNVMVTNFRASRDPYTLFSEEVYKFFESRKIQHGQSDNSKETKLAQSLKEYYKSYSKLFPNNLYRSIKYIDFWNDFLKMMKEVKSTQQTQEKNQSENQFFTIPSNGEKIFVPFSANGTDKELATLFESLIYSEEEVKQLQKWTESQSTTPLINYLKALETTQKQQSHSECNNQLSGNIQQVHHPALEHQTIKGSSPTSEGTQKDLMVYLAQSAILFQKIANMKNFETEFQSDSRKEFISKAWENAQLIASNYRDRLKKIREYFQSANIVDPKFDPEKKCFDRTNSKTLAIISYPPSQLGSGNSAIQTVSKYPFLYTEIGLKEVLPKKENDQEVDNHVHSEINEDILGLDDNGWWWRLGDSNFSENGFSRFRETADSIIFLASIDDWNILNSVDNPQLYALKKLIKNNGENRDAKLSHSSYHLWNEGLRSPLALNLLLDNLLDNLTKQFNIQLEISHSINGEQTAENNLATKYREAMDWGNYWEKQFVEGKASQDNNIDV